MSKKETKEIIDYLLKKFVLSDRNCYTIIKTEAICKNVKRLGIDFILGFDKDNVQNKIKFISKTKLSDNIYELNFWVDASTLYGGVLTYELKNSNMVILYDELGRISY